MFGSKRKWKESTTNYLKMKTQQTSTKKKKQQQNINMSDFKKNLGNEL